MSNRAIFAAAALILAMILFGSVVLALIFGIFDRADPADWADLEEFNRISMSAVGEMVVTAGERPAIVVDGNPRDVGRLRIYVEGAILHVEDRRRFALFQPPVQGIRYVVTLPELQGIEFSGAGRIDIDPLTTQSLDIKMSGVGTIDVQDLQADGVEVDFSGGGRAILHGTVADQSVSISGAGSYEAADLRTETARVRVSGAGAAELWVTDALDIDISGLGSVRYYGDPVVSQNVSGLGSVGSLGPKE
jgi:hypothetical protein